MKKAFTIIELVFVVIILGILAALALPRLSTSKDEAIISQALSNLKVFVNDISQYALKNENLSFVSNMSNVANVKNEDLSNLYNQNKELKFKVADDEACIKIIFIDNENTRLFGIVLNEDDKQKIQNIANLKNQSIKNPKDKTIKDQLEQALMLLQKSNFQNQSKSKICQSLSNTQTFKDLASRVYFLN